MKKTIYLLTCIFFRFFFLDSSPIHAESIGISLYPPITQITIMPGKSITQVFTLKNLNENPVTFTARIVPFSNGDSWGNPNLLPAYKPDWLKFFSLVNSNISLDKPFTVEANTSQQLVLNISIPTDTTISDRYATLLITQTIPTTDQFPNTRLSGSIGANILLSVNTTDLPPSKLSIEEFTITPEPLLRLGSSIRIYDNLDQLHFTIKAKNPNPHLIQVRGMLKVSNQTSLLRFNNFLPTYLLANSSRFLIASESSQLSFQPSLTDIGKFDFTTSLYADNASSSAQITLILLPIKGLLALLTVTLIAIAITKKRGNAVLDNN